MERFKTIKVALPIIGAAIIGTSFVIPAIVLTTIEEVNTRYAILATEYENGSFGIEINNKLANGVSQARAGDSIRIVPHPHDGYATEFVKKDGEFLSEPYTFTMPAKDVEITGGFYRVVPKEIEEGFYTVAEDGKTYVYNTQTLCSKTSDIRRYLATDLEVYQDFKRDEFNEIITVGKEVESIPQNFLFGCIAFNQKFDLTRCTKLIHIYDAFLCNCSNMNSEIILPDSLKYIGNGFLEACVNFNQQIDTKKVEFIGEDFLMYCNEFNSTVSIPNVAYINDAFMYHCIKFNKDLVIPDTLRILVDNFMVCCNSMTSTITFKCEVSVLNRSDHSLATDDATAACYTTGVKVAGPAGDAAYQAFYKKDGPQIFRKLIKLN